MRVALALRRLAGVEKGARLVGEDGHAHVEQRHVDVLAFARAVAVGERGEHGDGLVRSEWVGWQFGPQV